MKRLIPILLITCFVAAEDGSARPIDAKQGFVEIPEGLILPGCTMEDFNARANDPIARGLFIFEVWQKGEKPVSLPAFKLQNFTVLTEGPGSYGAEVNVAGRIIYGFNFRVRDVAVPSGVAKYGWWRLTFSLDETVELADGSVARGLSLDRCGNAAEGDEELTYTPVLDTSTQTSTLDIWIASASGGGGGGSGGHTDGSTSGHTPGGGSSGGGCGDH